MPSRMISAISPAVLSTLRPKLSADRTSVDLGVPDFRPAALPFLAPAERDRYRLDVGGRAVEFGAVSMGNPHVVISVEMIHDARTIPLGRPHVGQQIRQWLGAQRRDHCCCCEEHRTFTPFH